jgi:hypothetical protein
LNIRRRRRDLNCRVVGREIIYCKKNLSHRSNM